VIIPTYNNVQTLELVINGVAAFTNNIIVINDGSTDDTADVLKKFHSIEIINFPNNKGKGFALKNGFNKAIEKGYVYAITIDSDGQHNPEEMTLFLDQIEKEPNTLVIGVRNFNQENFPVKSGFANRFSNLWFKFFTDCKLDDTQSGYRLYPLNLIRNIKLFSGKYEMELELLVKAAWKNVKILSVQVNVSYPTPEKRVTHFRPFMDFARISILNTLFFFAAVLWKKPSKFLKGLNKKTIKQFFKNEILASKDSNTKIVLSVMLGVFMGIVPIWGYQLIIAIALAYIFRLNKAIVIVAANISIAPVLPLILYLSYYTGGLVMGANANDVGALSSVTFDFIKNNIVQYIVGSILLGIALSVASGVLTFLLLCFFRKSGRQ